MTDSKDTSPNPALAVYRDRCRHFTGIQHKTCAAGVSYESVRDPNGKPYCNLPCLDHGKGPIADTCSSRSFLTQEEHEARERGFQLAIAKAMEDIAAGKCHVCGAEAEPSKLVGRCRYNACGHRRGQDAGASDGY